MRRAALGLIGLALMAGPARAADCTLSATPMNFGAYVSQQAAKGAATLRVTCFSLTDQTVSLSIAPQDTPVSLTGGQGRLAYGLYLDPALSQPFAAAGPLTGQLQLTAGQSRSVEFTLYGRLSPRQLAGEGDYQAAMALMLDVR